jgi:hypothetical protein
MRAAGFFDLSVTADVGDLVISYFKRLSPGLCRVSGENSRRENRKIHTIFLSVLKKYGTRGVKDNEMMEYLKIPKNKSQISNKPQ